MTDGDVQHHRADDETSSSLLVLIKARDQEAWGRFVQLYGPLVTLWCRRFGLQDADVSDVRQEVFRSVAEAIGEFRRDRPGDSFRGWLRVITRTRVLDFRRRESRRIQAIGGNDTQARLLEEPFESSEAENDEDEQDKLLLVRRALDLVLDGCKEATRQAFLRVVIAGQLPAEVARDLGISVNAVYMAKSHILRRIREEYAEIVDD